MRAIAKRKGRNDQAVPPQVTTTMTSFSQVEAKVRRVPDFSDLLEEPKNSSRSLTESR